MKFALVAMCCSIGAMAGRYYIGPILALRFDRGSPHPYDRAEDAFLADLVGAVLGLALGTGMGWILAHVLD